MYYVQYVACKLRLNDRRSLRIKSQYPTIYALLALVDELNEEQPWPDGEDHTYWLWFATMLCSLNSLVRCYTN